MVEMTVLQTRLVLGLNAWTHAHSETFAGCDNVILNSSVTSS